MLAAEESANSTQTILQVKSKTNQHGEIKKKIFRGKKEGGWWQRKDKLHATYSALDTQRDFCLPICNCMYAYIYYVIIISILKTCWL